MGHRFRPASVERVNIFSAGRRTRKSAGRIGRATGAEKAERSQASCLRRVAERERAGGLPLPRRTIFDKQFYGILRIWRRASHGSILVRRKRAQAPWSRVSQVWLRRQ